MNNYIHLKIGVHISITNIQETKINKSKKKNPKTQETNEKVKTNSDTQFIPYGFN